LLSSSHYLSPSFLSIILTTSLPPSSSSLLISLLPLLFLVPLSLLPLPPTHCLSPSFRRKRMERKGEKGSEEDDYFNKFPPTMPSVVLENQLIRMFKVMPIGNSKWSTAKVKIALKTYELHFRNLIENH
jgi:hypothetical protein